MLLNFFPTFFKDIPWQKTRKNLDGSESEYLTNTNIIRGYMNYSGAIREPKILAQLYSLLNYKTSVCQEFSDIDAIKVYLQPHLDDIKQNHIKNILRYCSVELYLQMIKKVK
jgi:hypothetical protein